jgi:ribonuclease HI
MTRCYVVFAGKVPGIYSTWKDCQVQIAGFRGASFASFKDPKVARRAFAIGNLARWKNVASTEVKQRWRKDLAPHFPCLAVDAACSGCPGPVEYRGVVLPEVDMAFSAGPYEDGTNNIGEFLAIVVGLRWLEARSLTWPIFSDSAVAIGWVQNGGECRTTIQRMGPLLKSEVSSAEKWLRGPTAHRFVPLVRKWDTKTYGEIPADYDRK